MAPPLVALLKWKGAGVQLRILIQRSFCFIFLVLFAGTAYSQPYPARSVRIIVTFPAGGTSDILTRILGQKLSESFGQQVVVDNRAGGSGIIATELAARAAPDGYTLIMGYVGTHAINPALFAKLSYDPVKDFSPISLVAVAPNILVIHPSLPVRSTKELIALAKTKPAQLYFSSAGNGSAPHLAGVLFATMAGVNIVHVPYKGAPQATQDLIAGQVQMQFPTIPVVLPFIKSERLRAVAVTSLKRSPALPELPTIAESGILGYEAVSWYGVLGPAGLPRDVIAKLNTEIGRILRLTDIKDSYATQGAEAEPGTPEQFAGLIKSEIQKWGKVVRDSGAKID